MLKHHWPHVPNLGDVSKITGEQLTALGHIDLVVFGFPCQDISVSGRRDGLHDDEGGQTRSGLFFDAMDVVRRVRPRWVVVENVPGLYSSPKERPGADLALVLSHITGLAIDIPPLGWGTAGIVANPDESGYSVAWACLDSQYWGVPQRRRRVFLVLHLGDWTRPVQVLLDAESLSRNPPPSRQTWEGLAASLKGRAGNNGSPELGDLNLVTDLWSEPQAFKASHFTRGKDGAPSDLVPPLSADADKGDQDILVLPFDLNQITSKLNRSQPRVGDPCHPLVSYGVAPTIAFDCKAGEAVPALEQAPTLRSMSHAESHANGGGQVAVAFNWQAGDGGSDESFKGKSRAWITRAGDYAGALGATKRDAVAIRQGVRRLLPIECERLMAFPDNHTNIVYRGKPAADGPRYAALGDSMVTTVVAWIGQAIQRVEAESPTHSGV